MRVAVSVSVCVAPYFLPVPLHMRLWKRRLVKNPKDTGACNGLRGRCCSGEHSRPRLAFIHSSRGRCEEEVTRATLVCFPPPLIHYGGCGWEERLSSVAVDPIASALFPVAAPPLGLVGILVMKFVISFWRRLSW